jgi:hypothetical protein
MWYMEFHETRIACWMAVHSPKHNEPSGYSWSNTTCCPGASRAISVSCLTRTTQVRKRNVDLTRLSSRRGDICASYTVIILISFAHYSHTIRGILKVKMMSTPKSHWMMILGPMFPIIFYQIFIVLLCTESTFNKTTLHLTIWNFFLISLQIVFFLNCLYNINFIKIWSYQPPNTLQHSTC